MSGWVFRTRTGKKMAVMVVMRAGRKMADQLANNGRSEGRPEEEEAEDGGT